MKEPTYFLVLLLVVLTTHVSFGQTYAIADSLKALADTAVAKGNWAEATDFYNQAIHAEMALKEPRQDSLFMSLIGCTEAHSNTNSLDSALEKGLEAYNLAQELFPAHSKELAATLDHLGIVYYLKGEYNTALSMWLDATSETEKSLGKDHFLYGDRLSNVGTGYIAIGEYEKALPLVLEALEITDKYLGKQHSQYSAILNNLGHLYQLMGQYKAALTVHLEALEITEKSLGKEHSVYGTMLANISLCYRTLGQDEKALDAASEALENYEKSLGKNHPYYGNALLILSKLYVQTGQRNIALSLNLEALENAKKTLGKEHTRYGGILLSLADLYDVLGQYDNALPLYLEALEIYEKTLGKEHPYYGVLINNLALFYLELGQYDKALPLFLESLDQCEKTPQGKDHKFYSKRLSNLGLTYEKMGQNDKALPLYLEALERWEKLHGEDFSGLLLYNLAGLYRTMGQYDNALPLYLEALEIWEKTIGKEHSNYGRGLNELAELYERTRQYDMALPLYLEAMENTEKSLGKVHPDNVFPLNGLGGLYESMGLYDNALALFLSAEEIIFNQIDQSFSFLSEKEKEQFYKTVGGYFDHYISFFVDNSAENPSCSAQAFNIELALKGLILDTGIQVRASILNNGDSAAIATYETWDLQRTLISKQYSLPIAERRTDLSDLEERTEQLEAELTRISADFGEALATGVVEWKDVHEALSINEAVIEFSSFDYYDQGRRTDSVYYYAHVLLHESEYPTSVFLFEERELDDLLTKTNERDREYVQRTYGIGERGATVADSKDKVNLAELIWEPLATHLQGIEKVYYAPSGLLHRLNLNAIEVDTYTTIADKVEFVQMGSTGDLLDNIAVLSTPEEVTLFGGLQYSMSLEREPEPKGTTQTTALKEEPQVNAYTSRHDWGDLPYTLKEVESVASILDESEISHSLYSGEAGTEEAFLQLTDKNKDLDVIHFATHGYFFERDTTSLNLFMRSPNPLFRSGLIMSNANQAWVEGHFEEGQEDGVLTAYEISQLDLRNTELVVLSACETGLGDISNSEGVYGLQRAFKLAGVDYIIMTLWQVPDKPSKAMMEKFYRNWIGKGETIPEAFRNAQAEMRETADTYDWGGFVLVQ